MNLIELATALADGKVIEVFDGVTVEIAGTTDMWRGVTDDTLLARLYSECRTFRIRDERRAKLIEAVVADLVGAFLYCDRKEDEDLPSGAIEAAISAGEISINDIVELFESALNEGLAS